MYHLTKRPWDVSVVRQSALRGAAEANAARDAVPPSPPSTPLDDAWKRQLLESAANCCTAHMMRDAETSPSDAATAYVTDNLRSVRPTLAAAFHASEEDQFDAAASLATLYGSQEAVTVAVSQMNADPEHGHSAIVSADRTHGQTPFQPVQRRARKIKPATRPGWKGYVELDEDEEGIPVQIGFKERHLTRSGASFA